MMHEFEKFAISYFKTAQVTNTNALVDEETEFLKMFENVGSKTEYSTPISNPIAKYFKKVMYSDVMDAPEKFKLPRNCKFLDVPKVNVEI